MENTKIEWCDHTFNPWIGCTKVSTGCDNCHAETLNKRFGWCTSGDEFETEIEPIWNCPSAYRITGDGCWEKIRQLNRKAKKTNTRPKVFCASMSDWLDENAPLRAFIKLINIIKETQYLTWLLVTKRPGNWKKRMNDALDFMSVRIFDSHYTDFFEDWVSGHEPENVWMGTTIENYEMAEKRIPELLKIPAKKHFVSAEPLLSHIDLTEWMLSDKIAVNAVVPYSNPPKLTRLRKINWVICGGETGPNARPMNPNWVKALHAQCKKNEVPFFFKQWGEWHEGIGTGKYPERTLGLGTTVIRCGKKRAGRKLNGIEYNEFPKENTP